MLKTNKPVNPEILENNIEIILDAADAREVELY